jgi:hypothetical protein
MKKDIGGTGFQPVLAQARLSWPFCCHLEDEKM